MSTSGLKKVYRQLLLQAHEHGVKEIDCGTLKDARAARLNLYNFMKTVRTQGDSEVRLRTVVEDISMKIDGGMLIITRKEFTPANQALLAALGPEVVQQLPPDAPDPDAAMMLERLEERLNTEVEVSDRVKRIRGEI